MLSWTKLRVLQLWSTVRWNIHMWAEWQDPLTSPRLPRRQERICVHINFCKYGLVTFSFTKVISLRVKKFGYSVVPFHVIYLSIHHVLIDYCINWFIFFLSFRILVRAFHAPITPPVKRGLVTMDTAVFVLLDIREFSVKQVREKTPNDKMMSSIFNWFYNKVNQL